MKTEKKITWFSFLLSLLLLSFFSYGQGNLITKNKTVEKLYNEPDIKFINLFNAFGDIKISNWNENKLKVTITVNVIAWDEDDAEIFLDRIMPEMTLKKEKTGEYGFSSVADLTNIKNICNCKDKAIEYAPWFKKNAKVKQYRINYEIKIPASVTVMSINNNFGNVSLPDYKGEMYLNLRNGNLKAGKISLNESTDRLQIRYGKVNIESLKNLQLVLYSCKEVRIGEVSDVKISTRFSEIHIENCLKADVQSKSDVIYVNNLDWLSGNGNFTNLFIKNLTNSLTFSDKSGTIKIDNINPDFESVSLNGQFNDYVLNVRNLNFLLKGDFEFTDLECENNIYSKEKRESLITGQDNFSKKIGNGTSKSAIELKCSNCNVTLK